jgi:hypothetical protein
MMLFLDIYEKYASNGIKNIEDKDIDALFNAFATEAWVPISKELSEKIDKEINDMIEKGIPKKKK